MATYKYLDKKKINSTRNPNYPRATPLINFWYDLLKRIQIIICKAIDLISDE